MLCHALGTFILIKTECARLVLIDEITLKHFYTALELASKPANREYVIVQTFGPDVIAFLPAHNEIALHDYADHYDGLHSQQVRGIAACILLGEPIPTDTGNNSDGGESVTQKPKPIKPNKGGAAVKPLYSNV